MYKKILTFILALAMILCIVPISALAEDDVPQLYIVVEDSQGNLVQPTDSRINVDVSSKTLTIKGSDLTILSDFSAAEGGVDSPIGIPEEECNIVIDSAGKVTVKGYDGQTEGDHLGYYVGLLVKSFTQNNGDVSFVTTDDYDYALWCKGLFTMNGGTFTVDSSVESLVTLSKYGYEKQIELLHSLNIYEKLNGDLAYPISESAQTVINSLLNECKKLGIEIITSVKVINYEYKNNKYYVETKA